MPSVPGTLNYPTSLDDSTSLFEAANRARSTLSGSITSGSTSLTLVSAALFPSSGAITIEDEIIYYTGKSTNTLTGLLRGQDGTSAASHSSSTTVKMWIIRAHHVTFRSAIIATQTKLGIGSSTPTLGSFLTSRANGASTWGKAIGDTATANDTAWASKGASVSILQGGDAVADSASPSTGGNPSTVFQSTRSGGLVGNASVLFGFGYTTTGFNDLYGVYSIGRVSTDFTGKSGLVNHTIGRNYLIMAPAGLGSVTLAGYALWNQAESFVPGVNLVTTQNDTNNSTGADAPVGVGTSGRIISLAFGHAAGKHSTVDMMTEALNSNNSYAGWVVRANGYSQRILDYTDASMSLQGTWTATNGSATVSGSGGHADVEAIPGDILSINGTNATVLSATANSITLTAVFAGSTGSSLTLTKKVQPAWFANNSYLWWNNAANSARYRGIGLNASDVFSFDPDGRGAIFGGSITSANHYGGSAAGSTLTLNGTSGASVGAAHIGLNPLVAATTVGTVFIGAATSAPSVAGVTDVLHLQGTDSIITAMTLDSYMATNATGSSLVFRTARGSTASPSASQFNDTIAAFGGRPYNTTTTPGFAGGNRAAITLKCAENITDVAQGMYVTIEATPTGSTSRGAREYIGLDKGLTDTAINLFEIALAAGAMSGGQILWTIVASNGTDHQAFTGITNWAIVNKAGTYTKTFTNNTSNDAKAASSGTLTVAWAATDGTNKVTVTVTPTGSLTETTYKIYYKIINNSTAAITLL